jgi:hypothetical protein
MCLFYINPGQTSMSDWEQDVVEMLAGCNIDGKGDPIEENEVVYALGKDINEQVHHTLIAPTYLLLPFRQMGLKTG